MQQEFTEGQPTPSSEKAETYQQLKQRWLQLHGTAAPKNLSRRLLKGAVAYADQVRRHGGLSSATKKRLRELADDSRGASPKTTLTPGTRLVREWNGNTYVVEVVESGFRMGKRSFRSLTAAAEAITGSHWNGRAFFGLTKRKPKPSQSGHAVVRGNAVQTQTALASTPP